MTNADKFKDIFGLYAFELWSFSEKEFLEWLNKDDPDINIPVKDCISRQAAIEELNTGLWGVEWDKALATAMLKGLPSAQPERTKGKWIRKSPTAWMWTCSYCKKDDAYAYSAGESFEPDVLQDLFCPNCGADMRGEEG